MFIALIRSAAVKADVCSVPTDSETVASHWSPRPDSEIYLGFFRTRDDDVARKEAAKKAGVDPANIRLIELI